MTTQPSNSMTATPLQTASAVAGAVFLLVGVAGFIPGLTSNYESLEFAGHESGAMLLGLFNVSVLHNVVHLLFGVAGLALARTGNGAKQFLIIGGVVYLALWLYGLFVHDRMDGSNFVPLNDADNWLHLALGVAMVGLGVGLSRRGRAR